MQLQDITYQWQINFAVIISLLALFITLVRWFVDSYKVKKKERIKVYEEVYDDACFILSYPYYERRLETKKREYVNSDPELQKAVRDYINSHWYKQIYGTKGRIPLTDDEHNKIVEFNKLVQEEARKFQDSIFYYQIDVDLYEQSPVYHFNDSEVSSRFNKVMSYVGRHLSSFSNNVIKAWEDAKYKDHDEVRREYQKSLDLCDQYFKHNPRDFTDPFYDLLESIRQEYRQLTRRREYTIGPRISCVRPNPAASGFRGGRVNQRAVLSGGC